jgi:hypothetical protein
MYGREAAKQRSLELGVRANGSALCSMTDVGHRCLYDGHEETKVGASRKTDVKKVKVALTKKISVVKVVRPNLRPGLRGTSEIELALAKPIWVSKKFCFSDMPSSSLGHHDEGGPIAQMTSKHTSHVIKFVSLGDSSPDTHRPSPLGKTGLRGTSKI